MSHNRLSILDPSDAANQPFQNERYILAYNGEIYNYKPIREKLKSTCAVKFSTSSDTEVLFHALINYGIARTLNEIKGMFAFAFYDKREDELFLARDRLGIKPLFYTSHNTGFYWASEIKALAAALELRPDPTKTLLAIGGLGERSKRNTLFKGVYSVEPGSFLTISSSEKIANKIYYDPLNDFDPAIHDALERESAAAIVSQFEDLFVGSVKRMLIGDAPVGVFLSGGVDSSLISAIAKKQNADVQLFTSDVVGTLSEYKDAVHVAEHIGASHFSDRFEPEAFLEGWVEATYFYESPIVVHTNAVPFANVAKLARSAGVKAVLTGEGADELFLGYPRLLTRRYNSLALIPDKLLKSVYKAVPGLHEYLFPDSRPSLMSFVGNLAQNFEPARLDDDTGTFSSLNNGRRIEQKMTIKMLNEHLITLLHRNDRMGMMASIEARFPFLDEEIVKFAINLPSKYKITASRRFHNYKHPFLIDKWIVRKVAEKYLPKAIVYKRKFGFGMFGHKFIDVKPEFFKGGWVSDCLELDSAAIKHLITQEDPYYVAKLAAVEIFGRIFARNEDRRSISKLVVDNIAFRPRIASQ